MSEGKNQTSATSDNVYQRLLAVQGETIVPRQESRFKGGSRSAERILEALKPVCRKYGLLVFTTEVVELIGDRNRIKATATAINVDKPEETVSSSASAWEGEISSGLDASQVSGKTGSYAKKYALQHLFAIDDTKDADFEHEVTAPTEPVKTDDSSDAVLARAKKKINEALESHGYDVPTAKTTFIYTVLEHSTIDNLNEADLVMDALENES